jgi:hypothetical protein
MILGSEIREKLARNPELRKMERDVLSEFQKPLGLNLSLLQFHSRNCKFSPLKIGLILY